MSKSTLLLADDSMTIQKVVSLTFADKGMDVVTFSDGDAAIANLDRVRPDIVLADVHMPGMNGYQVCERIRGSEATKNTPVVLLVGSFEPFDRDEADRVGANTHLTKPFTSIADVVSTVERLLTESAASRESGAPEAPAEPSPDTNDIDSLYERSFVETMELPERGSIEYEVDGFDDDMIQTSYAEPDLGPTVEESFYPGHEGVPAPTVEVEEIGAESLIAESMPPVEEEAPPEPEQPAPDVAIREEETETSAEKSVTETAPAPDPFESVAEPPVQAEHTPTSAVRFSLEDTDLLELPGAPAPARTDMPDGRQLADLSPELIERIVEKVVERLAEKDRPGEAKSVSGS